MDRDETALILGIRPEQVRIIPTACGGGFGGKLDLGVHPFDRHRRVADEPAGTGRVDAPRVDAGEPQAPPGPDHGYGRGRR